MADPLGPVGHGEVSPFLTSFSTINTSLEILRRGRQTHRGDPTARPGVSHPLNPTCRVYVRNDTGATLLPLSVVKLGEPLVSVVEAIHDYRAQPAFAGELVDAADNAFAIVEDGAAADSPELVRAVVLGVVPCEVNVSDAAHEYATPADGASVLESATSGPCRILWKEDGEGVKKAVVLIDRQGTSAALAWETEDLGSDFDITAATGVFEDVTDMTLDIPSAGDYLVVGTVRGQLAVGAIGSSGGFLAAQVVETDGSTVIPGTFGWFAQSQVANIDSRGGYTFARPYTFADANTIKLQVARSGASFGVTRLTSSNAGTWLGYIRLG